MNVFDLFITPFGRINFAPDNETVEILQNVYTIISTLKFSVPLDREFGISANPLDSPSPKAMNSLKAEIVQAVRKFEPRAKVRQINYEHNLDGKLIMHLKVEVNLGR